MARHTLSVRVMMIHAEVDFVRRHSIAVRRNDQPVTLPALMVND